MTLKARIERKLGPYKIALNEADPGRPLHLAHAKRVAVIGGGIAGISAAANLAERGFQVDLLERENFLGGKVGSWTFESHGETLRTEHGFHAFFRQYYNLRAFMERIGAARHLIPIDDYVVLFGDGQRQGFRDLETTPGLNIWSLRRHGVYSWPTLINPLSTSFLQLLRYDSRRTYKQFDGESYARFARRTLMPAKMRLIFNSFSRAFFAEPENMSMADLIKGFHFYFLSNDLGLVYDVPDDDFEDSLLAYCRQHLGNHGVRLLLNSPVREIVKTREGFSVRGQAYDYAVLATDVKATRRIAENSPSLQAGPVVREQLRGLRNSGRYAVYRLWTDRFEQDRSLPWFVFTDRLACLDSVTFYHRMEKSSAAWSEAHGGGIFELHSYAVPDALADETSVKRELLRELYHYFPELSGMKIRHEYLQLRDDFPGFQPGQAKNRPGVVTDVPGLFLAGDWVRLNNPSMLMEAAYTSGAQAANAILTQEGLRENVLHSVPLKGLLS